MASKMARLFAVDEDREEAGVWISFNEGVRVRVRRLSSRRSVDVRKELDKPHLAQVRMGALPESVSEEIMLRQLAKGVIADWSGVDDDNGNEIPYTPENAYNMLKQYKEFRDAVIRICTDSDTYKMQIEEDASKNSSTSSPGA